MRHDNRVTPMTVGDYLGYLSDKLCFNPDLSNQPLYSENGILFGWEDIEEAAKRMDVPEEQLLTWINDDLIEGVRSNDHVIIPPGTIKPEIKTVDLMKVGDSLGENGEFFRQRFSRLS